MSRLRARPERKFFTVLPRADRRLAAAWWGVLIARGLLPPVFAIATGVLIEAVRSGRSLAAPLALIGVVFVAMQVLSPIHTAVSVNLGDRTAARDFDLGMQGPPLSISMDFIAGGLIELLGGISSAVVLAAFHWWAAILLAGAWLSTHWLLRESGVWKDRNTEEVRAAQRDSDYAYRLAVDAPAAKELRLFGLAGWTIERFTARRVRLHELQYRATKLRERPVLGCLLIVVAANAVVFWALASAGAGGMGIGRAVVFAQAAVGTSMIAFGGLNWALDGAAAPVAAVLRLDSAMAPAGALPQPVAPRPAEGLPAAEIRFRAVTFAYPSGDLPVLEHFDLTIPAGSSLAIVGRNGSGKTTLAKLLCRLYDPQAGAIEVDGVDLRQLDLASWRGRVTAVFQDFTRFELSLRDNVAPAGAPDSEVSEALTA